MKRKFLAKILAASLIFTAAPVMPGLETGTNAEELSIGSKDGGSLDSTVSRRGAGIEIDTELDCEGFWSKHTNGIKIDENGVTLTFKNTTHEDVSNNYDTPIYVIYTNNEPKVDNASLDYKEYIVRRSDNFTLDAFQSSTLSFAEFPENFDWTVWVNENKKGTDDYQISAVRENNNVLVKFISHGIVSYSSVPVEEGKPAYLSLTGEQCKLSEIKQVNYIDFTSNIPEGLFVEKLTGTGWWAEGAAYGRQYALTGNGTLDLYVGYISKEKDISPDGIFDIELEDSSGKIITTQSTYDAWGAVPGYNEVVTAPAITLSGGHKDQVVGEGHQYKVSITRIDNDVTVTYYDITSQKTFMEVKAEETKFTDSIKVKAIVQFGTFLVCKEELAMPEFKIGNCYKGTAWWTGKENTYDQVISGDGEVNWYIGYYENISNVIGAFSAELFAEKDGLRYFITTGSDVNAWYASEPENTTHTKGDNITGIAVNSKNIDLGHKYKVTVKRKGQDFTITYFDLDTNSVYAQFVAANTTFPEGDVKVRIMAQVGKYKIEAEPFDVMPEVKNNNKPLASYQIPGTGSGTGTSSASTPAPVPTFPPEDDEDKKDEEKEGIEMDFGAFWSAHLPGIEVTESGTALTYKNETHASAANNWNAPVIVAYSSDDTKVYETGYPGYDEYAVIRADSYAWSGAANTGEGRAAWDSAGYTFQTNATESTWNTWIADNKSGINGKVQAIKSNGKVYIEFTNGTVTTLTSFPVPEGKKVYISLTGEECKISNIKTAKYTGIDGVTVEPEASATPSASTEPIASPAPTKEPGTSPEPGNTSTPENPGTTNTPSEPANTATPEEPSNTKEPSGTEPEEPEKPEKKTMNLSGIKAKKGTKKVTGTVSVNKATVKVKVGNKNYKKAKVNGRKFTFTASSKLKKGTKITIKVTKTGYKAVTKTTKVK